MIIIAPLFFLWTSYVNWSIIIDVYNRQPSWIAKISMETKKIILLDLLCFNPICATRVYLRMQQQKKYKKNIVFLREYIKKFFYLGKC